MNDFTEYTALFSALGIGVSLSIDLFLLVVTTIFYIRKRTTASLVMLIGILLMLLQIIADPILMALIAHQGSQQLANYVLVNSLIGILPFLVFGIGLAIHLIQNMKKTPH